MASTKLEAKLAEKYPGQDVPVYDFTLENGQLMCMPRYRYKITETKFRDDRPVKRTYVIWTPMHTYYKEEAQLDKFLNNHCWSLDPDPRKALEIIRARLSEDDRVCRKERRRIDGLLEQLAAAKERLDTEGR